MNHCLGCSYLLNSNKMPPLTSVRTHLIIMLFMNFDMLNYRVKHPQFQGRGEGGQNGETYAFFFSIFYRHFFRAL